MPHVSQSPKWRSRTSSAARKWLQTALELQEGGFACFFKTSVSGGGWWCDGGCLLTTSVARGDEMLKQTTREALGEATVHRVIKHSKMTERLLEYKQGCFSLQEVRDDTGTESEQWRVATRWSQLCLLIGCKFGSTQFNARLLTHRSDVTKKQKAASAPRTVRYIETA